MSSGNADPKLVPRDFIFCGWRLHKTQLIAEIAVFNDEGIERTYHFKMRPHRKPAIGGVYTGAEFSESQARGLEQSLFSRMWEDQRQIIEWTALSEHAETVVRSMRNEANARKQHEIEDTLLPIRQQYANLLKRRDRAGLAAMEEAVLRALRAPIRSAEQR